MPLPRLLIPKSRVQGLEFWGLGLCPSDFRQSLLTPKGTTSDPMRQLVCRSLVGNPAPRQSTCQDLRHRRDCVWIRAYSAYRLKVERILCGSVGFACDEVGYLPLEVLRTLLTFPQKKLLI